jgi:hypothetical protein
VIDRSQKRHQLTHVDGLAKHHLVSIQLHDIAPRIPTGAGVGDLIEQFQNDATLDVPRKIGSVGSHQHRHGQLVSE